MKKTLVFYTERAPKETKSSWMMHEFRLDGKFSKQNLPISAKNEWVISREFSKTPSGKKTHISELNSRLQEPSSSLPPLTETSSYNSAGEGKSTVGSSSQVQFVDYGNTNYINQTSSSSFRNHYDDIIQFSDSYSAQDQSILKLLIDGNGEENDLSLFLEGESTADLSPEFSTNGPIDITCFMNF